MNYLTLKVAKENNTTQEHQVELGGEERGKKERKKKNPLYSLPSFLKKHFFQKQSRQKISYLLIFHYLSASLDAYKIEQADWLSKAKQQRFY